MVDLFLASSSVSCSYHLLSVSWCFNSLQLQELKPAAFAILASSNGSNKFLISSRAGARRKTGPQGHKQRELVHLFLAAAGHYISSAAYWARTINTGSEAASSIALTLPPYSFDVSIRRTNRILFSKIPSWIYAVRICLPVQWLFFLTSK